jgi:Tfp pilus assembly protein PilF/TolB-like protein
MRRWTLAIVILLLVAGELPGAQGTRTILVFPFENKSGRPDLGWMSEGFAEILSLRLAGPQRYVLGRDERNAACAQLGLPQATPLTLASEYKVAQILGLDWALVGAFYVEGDRLTARAQLLDVPRLKLSPPVEVTGALVELIDLQTTLAWRLLAHQDPAFTVGREEEFRARFPAVRLDAFENYIRGILATDDESRERFLLEADRLNPADHHPAFELGRFYFAQKDYQNSLKWLLKIEPSEENYQEALFLRAVDYFFLGQMNAAEKAFEHLARETPLTEVRNNLGVMKARRGLYREALADFTQAYQSDSTDPDVCFNLGVCLWYLKRWDEAAGCFREALQRNGDDAETHTMLAAVLGKLGDTAGRQRELAWLAEHEDEEPSELETVKPAARIKKSFDGRAFRLLALAIDNALEEKLRGRPTAAQAQAHLERGKEFLAEGRFREAEPELREAVSLFPRNQEAHLALAQLYVAQSRHREAEREFRAALDLEETVAAHLGLAQVYLVLNQPAAARQHSQAALWLDAGNREAEQLLKQIDQRDSTPRKNL